MLCAVIHTYICVCYNTCLKCIVLGVLDHVVVNKAYLKYVYSTLFSIIT